MRDYSEEAVAINFARRGRYILPHQGAHQKRNGPPTRRDPLDVMECFNCDVPGHMARECNNCRNYDRAAARKLDYHQEKKTPNSLHVVLAHLCRRIDLEGSRSRVNSEDR